MSTALSLSPKRVFILMIGGVLVTVVVGIGSIVLGNSFLQKQSDKLVNAKLNYQVPDASRTALKQAKADITKYNDLKNIAKTIVPQDKDQARTVREIINYADETYATGTSSPIKILSITFPGSNLGQVTTPIKVPSSGSTTPTTPVVKPPPVSQVQAADGIPGVYILPITVESDPASPVTFNQITSFLAKLEQNRRTAQVSQLSITPQKNSTTSGLSFTLTVNVYIKP